MESNGATRVLRVLVVDDHPVVREGLRTMLSGDPGVEVVGEARDGAEALEKAHQLQPDVVLTDIRMPGMSGIEVTRQLRTTQPKSAVVVLTMYDSDLNVMEALRAGATGYLVKDCSRELLCHTIHAVVDGGTIIRSGLLPHSIPGCSGTHQSSGATGSAVKERFTARELDVLRLVAQGYPNREIAREVSLAEVTVKKHMQSIFGKLGVSDRTQAAIAALRLGLVE